MHKKTVNNWGRKEIKALAFLMLLGLLLPIITPSFAEDTPNTNQLKKEISKANSKLKISRTTYNKLKKNADNAEKELHNLSNTIHKTEREINSLSTKLNKSNAERKKLFVQTSQQKDALAQQMQALYTSGKQSHLRLLLKQDNPSDISRTSKYFEYMNKHRINKISLIKTRLDKLKTLQTQIKADSVTLKALQDKQRGRKKRLKIAVKAKNDAYKKQGRIVYSDKQKLKKLQKEELRLQGVFQRLAEKTKREERQRKLDIEKAKSEVKRSQASAGSDNKSEKKQAKEKLAATLKRHFVPDKPFSKLRKKLSWPVNGQLTQKFGSTRNSKQRWKGVIISASAGSDVHAIARGKVEFSGRLRGYGYLVIIRHDKNYRSLYAYNRSVYKKEGQIVKAGDIIAAVGNSGSQAKAGLYFEIRKGTAPQNPNHWIR